MSNTKYLEGKNILIIGYGKSGKDSAKMSKELGGINHVYDERNIVKENMVDEIYNDINMIPWDKIALTISSPGVPIENEVIVESKKRNIDTIGEIEFGYRYSNGEIIAITGTNGKTTTTSMVGDILRKHSKNTYITGNIGIPLTEIALKTNEKTMMVVEMSSFQTETIKDFKPKVSAILNITEDHLNRHKTMERYISCKFNMIKNQGYGDYLILNLEDEYLVDYIQKNIINEDITIFWFTSKMKKEEAEKRVAQINKARYKTYIKKAPFENGKEKSEWEKEYEPKMNEKNIICIDEDKIILNKKQEEIELIKIKDIPVLGEHNIQNVMVAAASTKLMGIEESIIKKAIKEFKAVEHRMEFVAEVNKISYYNDSKATNPDSTIKALQAMDKYTVLLLGGSNKDSDYIEMVKSFTDKIKFVVLYGETKGQIEKALKKENYLDYVIVENLEQAVKKAREIIEEKNETPANILLSPACASFDQYTGYEERGKHFKQIVGEIK